MDFNFHMPATPTSAVLLGIFSYLILNAGVLAGSGVHGRPAPALAAVITGIGVALWAMSFRLARQANSKLAAAIAIFVASFEIAVVVLAVAVEVQEGEPFNFYYALFAAEVVLAILWLRSRARRDMTSLEKTR